MWERLGEVLARLHTHAREEGAAGPERSRPPSQGGKTPIGADGRINVAGTTPREPAVGTASQRETAREAWVGHHARK